MKVEHLRPYFLVSTIFIAVFSMVLIMGLILGVVEQKWLTYTLIPCVIVILINSAVLYSYAYERTWWYTKERLNHAIKSYNNQCKTYENATKAMQRLELEYHYKTCKLNDK